MATEAENDTRTEQDRSTPKQIGSVLSRIVERVQPSETPVESREDREKREAHNRQYNRVRDCWHSFFLRSEPQKQCTLETFIAKTADQEAILKSAIEFASKIPELRKDGNGAVIYGPVGTGKDHIAIGILIEAMRTHLQTARRINGPEWFGELRDRIDTDRRESEVVYELASVDWLLISDPLPPVGSLTDHQASWLYRVMDARQAACAPTIITINVKDREEAVKRMGAATWDRMRQNAWVFPCNWESHRKPARIIGAEK